jgi:hypothetical protein
LKVKHAAWRPLATLVACYTAIHSQGCRQADHPHVLLKMAHCQPQLTKLNWHSSPYTLFKAADGR